jgi:hypothetical protein
MKRSTRNFLAGAFAVLCLFASYAATVTVLLGAVTTTGASAAFDNPSGDKTYQAYGSTGTSTGTATVLIQGSNNAANWDTLGTISLALTTTTVSGGLTTTDRYAFSRVNVTTLAGTTPTLTVTRSY